MDMMNFFYSEGGELVAQGGGGCPIPGITHGQADWDSEKPGLVEHEIPIAGGLMGFKDPPSVKYFMVLW